MESKGFDLYKMVNGKWENEFNIPSDQSEWGTFKEISHNVENNIKELLADHDNKSNDEFTIVRNFYYLIMNIDKKTDKNEANSIINILKYLNHNKYDDRSKIGYMIGFLEIIIANPLFESGTNEDPKDTDRVRLSLSFPSLTLQNRIFYIDNNFAKYTEAYEKHANNILNIYSDLVGKKENLDSIINSGKKVVDLETKLARSTKTAEQTRDIDAIYSRMPIKSFINAVTVCDSGNNSYDCDTAKQLWVNYFNTAYTDSIEVLNKNNPNLKKKIPEELVIYDIHYFQKLTEILMTVPIDELMAYLSYKIINNICNMTIRSFDVTYTEFYDKQLSGQEVQTSRINRSLGLVNEFLGESLGKMYSDKYFNNESKKIVKNMVNNILGEMRESIKENKWMNKDTKNNALIKLDNMGVKIGFPDKYIDRSDMIKGVKERIERYTNNKNNTNNKNIKNNATLTGLLIFIRMCRFGKDVLERIDTERDLTHWGMNPHEVNAYYNPQMNEIVFPAGIMNNPIFDPSSSAPNNYGALGVIIAHEITHGFDDQGRKFDHKGNMKNWWTNEDQYNFNSLAKKMVEQYSKYKIETEDNIINVNGNLTLGENIADLGGITISYGALLSKKNLSIEEKKQFFESYALLWRQKMSPSKILSRVLSDCHSPSKYRVWMVRNLDDFYNVYGVTKTSPMYLDPKNRIKIY